jgi:isopentenyl diphosphate isomerase/L-lactate dehydrogenase-like FMN-dependent dehydrogenase
MLEIFEQDLKKTMILAGVNDVSKLGKSWIINPFTNMAKL